VNGINRRFGFRRLRQVLLICSTILASWLGMQAVHEFGHVLGARATGGEVERVILHPLTISRTDLGHNPRPLFVVWAGPVIGVLLPVLCYLLALRLAKRGAFVLRFFAGFCLIANGAYIGAGSFDGIGDAGQMLRSGSSPWHLWLFGIVTVPLGLWFWHRQGANFGLGADGREVEPAVAYVTAFTCALLIVVGLAFRAR
jgi:Peptidase M50B-like